MKRLSVMINVVGVLVVLIVLGACQIPASSKLPSPTSTIILPPTYTPTPKPTTTPTAIAFTPTPTFPAPTPVLKLSDDEIIDVAVAVFLHLTQYNDASRDAGPDVYLTIFDEDPSPEFLARFPDGGKRIRGGSEFEGRVEIFNDYTLTWGAVCGEDWGLEEAIVTCRELNLGFSHEAATGNYFGASNLRVQYSNFRCKVRF